MLNLYELEQFVTFADCGTLSSAAEHLHISQPTLTRTMRHVEDAFGASLFLRGRNRIELNDTGRLAAEHARKLLFEAEKAVQAVQMFDRSLRTIMVETCAPAPLWSLLPALSHQYPENTISSKITETTEIVQDVLSGQCDIGILPFACDEKSLTDLPYVTEKLFACIPKSNRLSRQTGVSFSELNGFNCLLCDQIGFWTALCRRKMPASRFLIQTDTFEFDELVRTSTLLHFSTDLANPEMQVSSDRTIIPVTDPEADVTYHLICRAEKRALLQL